MIGPKFGRTTHRGRFFGNSRLVQNLTVSFIRSKSLFFGTHNKHGAVLPKPVKHPFGLTKIFTIVIPFVFVGGILSSNGAQLLHDYDIFSPEDD